MNEQPKNDPKSYRDLISEIQKGEIKIPKFQRNFVWSLEQTAKLLDSIVKGYPIGTFVMRRTSERLNDIKNIGNLGLPGVPDGVKVQYVLDGQQRMTSLYAAYCGAEIQKEGEKRITNYKEIYVDLDVDIQNTEGQIVTEEKPAGNYISLHKVLNSDEYYDDIEEYEKEYKRKINDYKGIFQQYQFSTVVLRKEDIGSAIEVFTRINTGGKPLSLFEIMSAKTFDEEQKFDMAERFNILLSELELCGYETISSSIILSLLSLIISNPQECKSKTILQLDKQEIITHRDSMIESIKHAIDYLRSVYNISVGGILPYDSLIVPFAYFFYKQKDGPKGKQVRYMEEFFWKVSLSYRYSNATEAKLAQDIKRINKILENEQVDYDDFKVNLESPKTLIGTNFSAGSSYCKAIICLLASCGPKDFQNNGKIHLDNSWLKVASSKNYHHFFPKAYLVKNKIDNENSIVNITLVSDKLNKGKIKAKAPSIYIDDFGSSNPHLQTTLETHLIGDINDFGIISNDYDVFLTRRALLIFNELKKRLNGTHSENTLFDNTIDHILKLGEGNEVEFKSTLCRNLLGKCKDERMEHSVLKTIAGFNNKEGGTLLIGINDGGEVIGLNEDYELAQLQNRDKFELHLKQLMRGRFKIADEYIARKININFEKIDGKDVCSVVVEKGTQPIFTNKEEFFVRDGNSTIELKPSEIHSYVNKRFNI